MEEVYEILEYLPIDDVEVNDYVSPLFNSSSVTYKKKTKPASNNGYILFARECNFEKSKHFFKFSSDMKKEMQKNTQTKA